MLGNLLSQLVERECPRANIFQEDIPINWILTELYVYELEMTSDFKGASLILRKIIAQCVVNNAQ